jgi:hypothetical protein
VCVILAGLRFAVQKSFGAGQSLLTLAALLNDNGTVVAQQRCGRRWRRGTADCAVLHRRLAPIAALMGRPVVASMLLWLMLGRKVWTYLDYEPPTYLGEVQTSLEDSLAQEQELPARSQARSI